MELPNVDINALIARVAETKSASTAHYYIAMLKRLETYNQSSLLDLNLVDSGYVSGFGEFLIRDGVTLSTVKLYKMAFRAVMKESFGTEHKALFKGAFKNVDSKQDTVTNCISYEDLLKIINCNLEGRVVIERVRLVFLYCVFSGGLSLKGLQQQIKTDKVDQSLPQQAMIFREFGKKCNRTFEVYVSSLQEEKYSQILELIGILAGITSVLKPQSAMDAWISAAKLSNVPIEVIASILPSDSSFSKNITLSGSVPEVDKLSALKITANKIVDMKPRWFVMKYFNCEPTEIDNKLSKAGVIVEDDTFSSFIPPKSKALKGKTPNKKSVTDSLYFFNCMSSTAIAISKEVRPCAWVFTQPGSSMPAQISDSEMKTFMLLCDASEGTLTYHFPDIESNTTDLTIGQEAQITNGNFCGQIGVIKELSNNKYKVVMSFTAISAKVIAEVPIDFIKSL